MIIYTTKNRALRRLTRASQVKQVKQVLDNVRHSSDRSCVTVWPGLGPGLGPMGKFPGRIIKITNISVNLCTTATHNNKNQPTIGPSTEPLYTEMLCRWAVKKSPWQLCLQYYLLRTILRTTLGLLRTLQVLLCFLFWTSFGNMLGVHSGTFQASISGHFGNPFRDISGLHFRSFWECISAHFSGVPFGSILKAQSEAFWWSIWEHFRDPYGDKPSPHKATKT